MQIALSFGALGSLIVGFVLASLDVRNGHLALFLFLGCVGLRSLLNVISGIRRGVVYSEYGIEIDQQTNRGHYVWIFGWSVILASLFALLAAFIYVFRVIL